MNKIKIMVVDGHPAYRKGLARIFREETDLDVVGTSSDGNQAVKAAPRLKPDIIIMDISMPKMNGIEATKQIKARNSGIGIIVLSAFSYPSYVLGALSAGASSYLLKNTPMEEILKAIRIVYLGGGVFDNEVTRNILRRLPKYKAERK